MIRPSTESDFVFLCHLRKLALLEAVETVFGWNETIQKEIEPVFIKAKKQMSIMDFFS